MYARLQLHYKTAHLHNIGGSKELLVSDVPYSIFVRTWHTVSSPDCNTEVLSMQIMVPS